MNQEAEPKAKVRGWKSKAIIELARQGFSPNQVAEKLDCFASRVYSVLCTARKAGLLPPKPKVHTELLAAILRLQKERGLSHRDIAKELKIPRVTISRTLNAARLEGLIPAEAPKPVKLALGNLTPEQRQEIRDLHYMHGHSVSELSKQLGKPEDDIRRLLAATRVFGMAYQVELRRVVTPKPKEPITDWIKDRVLHLYNVEHYNVTAISEELQIEAGDAMEIVRDNRLLALAA